MVTLAKNGTDILILCLKMFALLSKITSSMTFKLFIAQIYGIASLSPDQTQGPVLWFTQSIWRSFRLELNK